MRNTSTKDKLHFYVTVAIFSLLTLWWVYIQVLKIGGATDFDMKGQTFAAGYGFMALWGGFVALVVSKKWGFLSSLFGRSLLAFAIGLLLQEFGQLSYSFYIYFMKVEIPYPSVGDIGYFGSIFFYIYGAFLLFKVLSTGIKGRGLTEKVLVVVSPLILLAVSYSLLLRGHEFVPGETLRNILDIGYPLLQCLYVSLAFATLVLFSSKSGGFLKKGILMILVALISQYIADFTFLFKAGRGTYYPGGPVDFLYLVAYFLMTVAIIELDLVFERLKSGKITNGGAVT